MKIIDLLNKIAKGEEMPGRIKYGDYIYVYSFTQKDYYSSELNDMLIEYILRSTLTLNLNEQVEILEEVEDKEYEDITEMKIEYDDDDMGIDGKYLLTNHSEIYADKINALIRNQKYILKQLNK